MEEWKADDSFLDFLTQKIEAELSTCVFTSG